MNPVPDQPFGQEVESAACHGGLQPELVVMQPSDFLKADATENGAPEHHGGIGDQVLTEHESPERALGEHLLLDPGIEGSRNLHAGRIDEDRIVKNDFEVRGSLEGFELSLDLLGVHEVVAVGNDDELPARSLKAAVEGFVQAIAPLVLLDLVANPGVLQVLLDDLGRAVRRAIVQDEELKVPVGLVEHRLNRRIQVMGIVIDIGDHADTRNSRRFVLTCLYFG
ncbi:hypothetical protein D3C86_992400 [compost metagenome]